MTSEASQREARLEYDRNYYRTHREQCLEYARKQYYAQSEEYRERRKEYFRRYRLAKKARGEALLAEILSKGRKNQ
jgi:hypothetical protein